jgi:SanA protein
LRRLRLNFLVRGLAILIALGLAVVLFIDRRVAQTDVLIRSDVTAIEPRPVGLLLGTSKTVAGRPNLHFERRMAAAAALFEAGKIERILVSGDRSGPDYDEPADMQAALVALGVPPERIDQDPRGYSTLASLLRAQRVYGLDRITIISQRSHCQRALYIAGRLGIDAIGFAAADVHGPVGWWVRLREALARVKAVIEVRRLELQEG